MTCFRVLVGGALLLSGLAFAQSGSGPTPSCTPPAVWSSILQQCIGDGPSEPVKPTPERRPPQVVEVLAAAEQAKTAVLLDFTFSPRGLYGVTIGREFALWRMPHFPLSLGLSARGSVLIAPTLHPLVFVPLRGTATATFTVLPDALDVILDVGGGGALAAGTAYVGRNGFSFEPIGGFGVAGVFIGSAGASVAYRFSSVGLHVGAEVLFGGQPTMLLLSLGLSL